MATLTATELGKMLRQFVRQQAGTTATWDKDALKAALQAVETRLDNSKGVLNTDIETAAPGEFNVAQKLAILAWATLNFAKREGSI